MNEPHGTVTEPGTIRLERLLPGPVERIWAYLTESDKRAKWLAPGTMDLRVGGRVTLTFKHADLSSEKITPDKYKQYDCGAAVQGTITRCDPPRLLSFTWGDPPAADSEVTFEITPRDQQAMLIITHRRLNDRDVMISVSAGWHAHIGLLIDHLAAREPRPFWSTHARLEAEYRRRIQPKDYPDAKTSE